MLLILFQLSTLFKFQSQFFYAVFFSKFLLPFNPACGGTFFTVRLTIAKIVNFCDLNRTAVARALGCARAMAISMARGGDGKRT